MLSAVVGEILNGSGGKACVLAHRDEITSQNIDKFKKINPQLDVSIVDAKNKSWEGDAVFAMVQTLSRWNNLEQMPKLKILVVDEAHHAEAATYRRVIDAAKKINPQIKLFGVTATPNRGDGKSLRDVFDNCADQISLAEMIASGQLVKPRAFVIDLGVQDELKKVRRLASEFDMAEVAEIMDHSPLTEAVVRHWKEMSGDRRTVVFCSTIDHASHVLEYFKREGILAELVTGETLDAERIGIFSRLESGETQVLVNVAVATEGWDCPPIACVVLLRPCSHKSTMIQMIGRGLRKLEPDKYPGMIKNDCIVLDFGTSILTHGTLDQEVTLDPNEERGTGLAPTKICPECHAEVPIRTRYCPFCEHEFEIFGRALIKDFKMTEVDLLNRSSFQWCDISGQGSALMATGFSAWAGVFFRYGLWHALGGALESGPRVLYTGDRIACLASADDWMNSNETEETAHKSRRWLQASPTEKQIKYLPKDWISSPGLTRYKASCFLSFKFNQTRIERLLFQNKLKVGNPLLAGISS